MKKGKTKKMDDVLQYPFHMQCIPTLSTYLLYYNISCTKNIFYDMILKRYTFYVVIVFGEWVVGYYIVL